MWQDTALSILQFWFLYALRKVIVDPSQTMPREASVKTAALLWAMAVIMATAEWWLSAGSTALIASAWSFIAWRRAA